MSENATQIKLVSISEEFISIQNEEATMFDYSIKIDKAKLKEYQRIQKDFLRMQEELLELIKKS